MPNAKSHHARIVCAAPKKEYFWSAADDTRLKDLWENSANSAAEIGVIMGKPRCGVIGRSRRLELKPRKQGRVVAPRPVKRLKADKPAVVKEKRYKLVASAPRGMGAQIVHAAVMAASVAPEVQRLERCGLFSGEGMPLLRAGLRDCSWPYDGHPPDNPHCCGARVAGEGMSYCATHADLAYPRRRSEEKEAA